MKVIASVGRPKAVKLSASRGGGFAPWPADLGLCSWTPRSP